MKKAEIQKVLDSAQSTYEKNLAIAKRNIANAAETIVRNVFGGKTAIDDGALTLECVPFVPEKQKDQVFHRLEARGKGGAKSQSVSEMSAATVVHIYLEVYAAAEAKKAETEE